MCSDRNRQGIDAGHLDEQTRGGRVRHLGSRVSWFQGGVQAAANLLSFIGIFLGTIVYYVLKATLHLDPRLIFVASAVMTLAGTIYAISLLPDSLVPGAADRLAAQLEVVTGELRRRIGQTFTLEELVAIYDRAEAWVRDVVSEHAATPGWPRALALVEDAAFHLYQRGAVDYKP